MSRNSRTRTNVGITSARPSLDESQRLNSRPFDKTLKSNDEFIRTSLPMHNNRGGQGDKKSRRDKWKAQSHDKTMSPTERISRQTGELPWRAAPPQVYMRALDNSLERASATCFNKYALDKDQDGKLNEADLFYKTTAGEVGKANQTMKAMQFVTATMGNNVEDEKVFEEKVDEVAKQRALVGDILERNKPHLNLFSLNPGKRTTYIKPKYCDADMISSSQKESTEDDISTRYIGHEHFIPSEPLENQIDQAMEIMNDSKTYNVTKYFIFNICNLHFIIIIIIIIIIIVIVISVVVINFSLISLVLIFFFFFFLNMRRGIFHYIFEIYISVKIEQS
jgi:hypothetical protein